MIYGLIALIVLVLVITGLIINFLIKKKKEKEKEEPNEPEVPETPSEPETPKEPEVPEKDPEDEPKEPEKPEEPEDPKEPDEEPKEPEKEPEDEPQEPEVDELKDYALKLLDDVLTDSFNPIINVNEHGNVFVVLCDLSIECVKQFYDSSEFNLPKLFTRENFPYIYDFHEEKEFEEEPILKTMIGLICALLLSELVPNKKNELDKAGYNAGGFTRKSPIYGYPFKGDPNASRLVAAFIFAAMHNRFEHCIDELRDEVGGSTFDRTFERIVDEESRNDVKDTDFYIDLRKFMASAPGPYAPGYTDRSSIHSTFPDEKCNNQCLKIDMEIYNLIVEVYNLDHPRAVQAIADEDADLAHIFGTDKRGINGKYDFNAVFGETTIGRVIDPKGPIAQLIQLAISCGSTARGILQHANKKLGGYEYGRLRPGCSETQEAKRKSTTDDRYNVLSNFWIEDNDGNKVTYDEGGIRKPYYDKHGNWTNKKVKSPEQYEQVGKDALWANSYPSGHSSALMNAALTLTEIFPELADKILRAANDFAVSRTIARYHWNSDTIQGRILAIFIFAIQHATSNYYVLLKSARDSR